MRNSNHDSSGCCDQRLSISEWWNPKSPFALCRKYDLRSADITFVSQQRWDETPDDDNLQGSPELVVEIFSPSNTKTEMREKSALYLSTGTQFWVVDPQPKTVRVTDQGGVTTLYQEQDRIPLPLFGSDLTLHDLFRS